MSSIPTSRECERESRRHLLLQAADRVFGRIPFEEASTKQIANEAQIGMRGFYEHFPSKEALYEELAVTRGQALLTEARRLHEADLEPREELKGLTFILVGHFHDHPTSLPTLVWSRSIFDWGLESRFLGTQAIYDAFRNHLKNCLSRLVSGGQLKPMPLEFLTELYLDVFQACLQYNHRNGNHEEVHICVARILECFLNGAGERP
jgi:AcrR family transcriptional regulator